MKYIICELSNIKILVEVKEAKKDPTVLLYNREKKVFANPWKVFFGNSFFILSDENESKNRELKIELKNGKFSIESIYTRDGEHPYSYKDEYSSVTCIPLKDPNDIYKDIWFLDFETEKDAELYCEIKKSDYQSARESRRW